jgi:hypothetical protein
MRENMSLTVVNTDLNEADAKWGYRFGIDGVVSIEQAQSALANASRNSINRRIADGLLRTGKDVGRVVICKRSLTNYIAGLEK